MGGQKIITAYTLTYCCLDEVGATEGLRVNEWCDVTPRAPPAVLRRVCRSKETSKAENGDGGRWPWLKGKTLPPHSRQGSTTHTVMIDFVNLTP